MSDAKPKKLLFDCDPGIDDAAAFVYVADQQHYLRAELVGLVTVGGNVPVAQTTRAAALLLTLADLHRTVPLYQGFDSPTLPPPNGAHGADGLGGCFFFLPHAPQPEGTSLRSVLDVIGRSGPDLTIVCSGPLTNAALWAARLQRRRDIDRPRWVVIGGTFEFPGINMTPTSEFNLSADAEAAKFFFDNTPHVDVIPLTVTESIHFTLSHIAAVGEKCPWFGDVLSTYAAVHRKRLGADRFPLHDLVGMASLFEPDLFTFRKGDVRIDVDRDAPVARSTFVESEQGRHRLAVGVAPAVRTRVWSRVMAAVERTLSPRTGLPSESALLKLPDLDSSDEETANS